MGSTLLLNASYEPLSVISWRRAVVLFFTQKAEILEEYEEIIASPSIEMGKPSVVRLHDYVRRRRNKGAKFSRKNIYARDNHQCQYCAGHFTGEDLSFDHVHPRALGGKTTWENIVTCCLPCNRRKGGRSPAQAGMHLLKEPVKPNFTTYPVPHREGYPDAWDTYLAHFKRS